LAYQGLRLNFYLKTGQTDKKYTIEKKSSSKTFSSLPFCCCPTSQGSVVKGMQKNKTGKIKNEN
jgi:hypothetical protein